MAEAVDWSEGRDGMLDLRRLGSTRCGVRGGGAVRGLNELRRWDETTE